MRYELFSLHGPTKSEEGTDTDIIAYIAFAAGLFLTIYNISSLHRVSPYAFHVPLYDTLSYQSSLKGLIM